METIAVTRANLSKLARVRSYLEARFTFIVAGILFVLLLLFVAYPVGAVLVKSFLVGRPGRRVFKLRKSRPRQIAYDVTQGIPLFISAHGDGNPFVIALARIDAVWSM